MSFRLDIEGSDDRVRPGRARTRGGRAAWLAGWPIRVYRWVVSPVIGPRCRYLPSCSEYAVQAVRSYGVVRGTVLAAWRLLRCNPWSHGGVDFVEDQKLFRPRPHVQR